MKTVTVTLDSLDARLIGQTLRALAYSAPKTDPSLSARLLRVGAQLASAALVEETVAISKGTT